MTLPVFPLGETALLPHTLLPLHIFEPRYRQLIDVCRRTDGRFVMATIERHESTCRLREAACTARLLSHDALADGRFNIVVHGIERVRILSVIEPCDDRLYHMVRVEPLETNPETPLPGARRHGLLKALGASKLSDLHPIDLLRQHAKDDDVPLRAIVDMIGSAMLHCREQRYAFLAEADPLRRLEMAELELRSLNRLITHAEILCEGRNWPEGMNCN